MFYLNSTLIPPVSVFQLEVYYKVDRLLTGLTAQQKGATALDYKYLDPWQLLDGIQIKHLYVMYILYLFMKHYYLLTVIFRR